MHLCRTYFENQFYDLVYFMDIFEALLSSETAENVIDMNFVSF